MSISTHCRAADPDDVEQPNSDWPDVLRVSGPVVRVNGILKETLQGYGRGGIGGAAAEEQQFCKADFRESRRESEHGSYKSGKYFLSYPLYNCTNN